jgi:lipoate-protein ligase A
VAGGRLVEVMAWRRIALVLGSTQPLADADPGAADRLGADVVRRRSGGGAVVLRPGRDVWIDVTIPHDDPLWEDDVAVSFHWLGRAWVDALGSLGIGADVHLGAATTSRWSRLVCFAALGAGEVTAGGRKLVGLSQRRTREAARFQCLVPGTWDAAEVVSVLSLDDETRAEATDALASVAVGAGRPPAALTAALLAALPATA